MLMALMMVIGLLPITALAATGDLTLTVESVESAAPGDIVDVVVNVDENPGMVTMQVNLGYDAAVFEPVLYGANGYVTVIIGFIPIGAPCADRNPVQLTFEVTGFDNTFDTGMLATVRLRVRKDAPSGQSAITLRAPFGINEDMESLPFITNDGYVNIVRGDEEAIPTGVWVTHENGDAIGDEGVAIAVNTAASASNRLMVNWSDEETGATADDLKGGTVAYQWTQYNYNGTVDTPTGAFARQRTFFPQYVGFASMSEYICEVTYTPEDGEPVVMVSQRMPFGVFPSGALGTFTGFSTPPSNASGPIASPPQLTATVLRTGTVGFLTYQWFASDDGESFTPAAAGSTTVAHNVKVEAPGTYYYYLVVTTRAFTDGVLTSDTITSDTIEVTITAMPFAGSGTESDPYLISNLVDLQAFNDLVTVDGVRFTGSYVKMTNDITLPADWRPIGTNARRFAGVFDGGGHTITYGYGSSALFGHVGYIDRYTYEPSVVIKNLNIYGEYIADFGLVGGYNTPWGTGTINGIITFENIIIKSGTTIRKSGIIGDPAAVDNVVRVVNFKNCLVEDDVWIGWTGDRATGAPTVHRDYFVANSSTYGYPAGPGVGSFIDGLTGSADGVGIAMDGCVSYATVYGQDNVGGLVGYKGQTMRECVIQNSEFHGTVIATGNFVGGIIGSGYDAKRGAGLSGFNAGVNSPGVGLRNNTVTGSVTGNNYVGGIFGGESLQEQEWDNGAGYGAGIWGNHFEGTVTATATTGKIYIGGVIGYMNSLNKYNVIENNTFTYGSGADKGIGGVLLIDTNHPDYAPEEGKYTREVDGTWYFSTEAVPGGSVSTTPWNHEILVAIRSELGSLVGPAGNTGGLIRGASNRTDDPLGADADKLVKMLGAPDPEPVDKTELNAAIDAAEALAEAEYTVDTWAVFASALAAAQEVSADDEATQDAVDTALNELESAIAGLEAASATPTLNDDGYYELATIEDLLWFTDYVNVGGNYSASAILTADIDASANNWVPIGDSATTQYEKSYLGTFDGDGHTVTIVHNTSAGTSSYKGFFGYIGEGAVIKNLTIDGVVTCNTNIAGIVGYANGATIENCINKATVTTTGSSVAGIVVYAANSTIANCTNEGTIKATGMQNAAGIVQNLAATALATDCVNTGNITAIYHVAGIASSVYGTVENSTNSGTITATATTSNAIYGAGGITATLSGTVRNSYNTGLVTGTASSTGGVVGILFSATAVLSDSYNTGTVISTATPDTANVGGVVGRVHNATGTVKNTFNTGSVSFAVSTSPYVGGAIGYAVGTTNVANNYYLNTVGTDTYSTAVTASQLFNLATSLGSAYKQGAAHPILSWQTDEDIPELADKSALDAAIAAAEALVETEYTADTWAVFASALAAAKAVSADDDATQTAVDSALSALESAIAGLKVPVTSPETNGYEFNITGDAAAINAGEEFTVTVTLSGRDAVGTFEAHVDFDDALLEYVSLTTDTCEAAYVTNGVNSGNIVFTYTGEIIPIDDTLVIGTVTFKAKQDIAVGSESASVSLTSKSKAAETIADYDPSVPAIIGDPAQVDIYNLAVTFTAGVGVDMASATAYVKYGEAGLFTDNSYTTTFSFPTAAPSAGYRLADPLWDGTYSNTDIENMTFTDSAAFTAQAVKLWSVSFYGYDALQIGDTQFLDDGEFATAPADPSEDNMTFMGWFITDSADDVYTSGVLYSAADIADIAVTSDVIYKAHFTGNRFEITYPGDLVSIISGVTSDDGKNYVQNGTDVTFTLSSSADTGYTAVVTYQIGSDDAVVMTAEGGVYTIPGAVITGDVVVAVSFAVDGIIRFIPFEEYKGAPEGYKVMVLELNSSVIGDLMKVTYSYDGTPMFRSDKYDAYVIMVDEDLTAQDALAGITAELVDVTENIFIAYSGDVYIVIGEVDSIDALAVYELYDQKHTNGFGILTELQRFEADVNGDGRVDLLDVRAIQSIILGIS